MPADGVNLSFPAGWQTISQEVSNAVSRGFLPKLEQMGIEWGMIAGFTYGEVQPGDKELTAIMFLSEAGSAPIDEARKRMVVEKLAVEGGSLWPGSTSESFNLKTGETGALIRIPNMQGGSTPGGCAMLWWVKGDRLRMLVLITPVEKYTDRVNDFEFVINSMAPM